MTKDFKRPATANSLVSQYGIGWMLGGVAIGLTVGLALYKLTYKDGNADAPVATVSPTASATVTPEPSAINPALRDAPKTTVDTGQERPEFNYYAVLPQLEVGTPVVVPEPPAAPKTTAKPQTVDKTVDTKAKPAVPAAVVGESAKPTDNPVSVAPVPKPETKPAPPSKPGKGSGLQLGAYKSEAQAIALQKRVQQGGLNSRVEKTDVSGTTVFRVRIGPATSPEMLESWKKTLSGMGITPLSVSM